jgi:hypothetical protein
MNSLSFKSAHPNETPMDEGRKEGREAVVWHWLGYFFHNSLFMAILLLNGFSSKLDILGQIRVGRQI